jgi:hypothetical protein
MNKQLLLALYDRSGLGAFMPVDYKGHELTVEQHWEKFAQLIVAECIACSNWVGKMNANTVEPIHTAHAINQRIKKHFGVEE